MKISAIHNNSISFGRSLKPDELEDFKHLEEECKSLTSQTGKSVFIVHDACLPQSPSRNTGVGNISSQDSLEFFKYMKPYLGYNMVEVLPPGQVAPVNNLYCAYAGTSLSLGNHQINPELLTTDEFDHLLTQDEFNQIVKANTASDKETIVNYKNVMDNDGEQNRILKIAHKRFKAIPEDAPLKINYSKYVQENSDWLDIPREYEPDLDFFRFKQFLADEHLKIGKKQLNDMGVKLCGDCLIGFSQDEVAAFPNAFKKDHFIGDPSWNLPALDYDSITNPESDAAKLLKRKVQLFAKRYDAIRFDVGWAYIAPVVTPKDEHRILNENKKFLDDKVIKFIENAVKEIKGEDFDLHDLMYEMEASPEDFSLFKPNSGEQIDAAKGRVKIMGTTYMHWDDALGWGTNDAYIQRGWSPDEFVLGVGNHDPQPLRQIANDVPEKIHCPDGKIIESAHKQSAVRALAKIFHQPEEVFQNPVEFAKAKWAVPMRAKNMFMFYMDVFGREERFDMQGFNTTVHPEKNYAYKIPHNYQKAYQDAIKEGFGFNIMDGFERLFRLMGLNQTRTDLYEKIVKYRDILLEPEKITPPETITPVSEIVDSTPTQINSEIIEETAEQAAKNIKKSSKKWPWITGILVLAGAGSGIYINKQHKNKTQIAQPKNTVNKLA